VLRTLQVRGQSADCSSFARVTTKIRFEAGLDIRLGDRAIALARA
jgi:hypothetical protein